MADKSFDPQCAELAVEFLSDAGYAAKMTDEKFQTASDALAQEIQDVIEAFIANLESKGDNAPDDDDNAPDDDEDDEDDEDNEEDEEDEDTQS